MPAVERVSRDLIDTFRNLSKRKALVPGALFASAFVLPPGIVEAGVGIEGGITVVAQRADEKPPDDEVVASGDLFVTLDTGGGQWLLYVEGNAISDEDGVSALYPTANADARSVFTRSGGGAVQVSEFNYTAKLSADRTLTLGLIDPSAWLDRGRIANDENQQFMNGSFVNNATISFPDYTLGAVYEQAPSARRPV